MSRIRTTMIATLLTAALLATPAIAQDFVVGPAGQEDFLNAANYADFF